MNVIIGLLPLRRALSRRSCGLDVTWVRAVGFDICAIVRSVTAITKVRSFRNPYMAAFWDLAYHMVQGPGGR
jgi:hypothetical protein